MAAYYNEFDPFAAQWLRNLIAAGHIAPGDVDTRSIEDVQPDDLRGYAQCHFFAGIGGWSLALRLAGWADDRPVWTGSCPCQPFSAAGKGAGFDDSRHLWPVFARLIRECGPDVVLGEQVAAPLGLAWLDHVCADLEAAGYAAGAVDTCAAGFGAPHIRQRLYWAGVRGHTLADPDHAGLEGRIGESERAGQRAAGACGLGGRLEHAPSDGRVQRWAEPSGRRSECGRGDGGLADAEGDGHERRGQLREPPRRDGVAHGFSSSRLAIPDDALGRAVASAWHDAGGQNAGRAQGAGDAEAGGGSLRLDAERHTPDRPASPAAAPRMDDGDGHGPVGEITRVSIRLEEPAGGGVRPGPTNGHWRDADWLGCRDGKWRPVEPRTFPLAHGVPARVGRLRGYGNAIVAPQASAFVGAVMEALS